MVKVNKKKSVNNNKIFKVKCQEQLRSTKRFLSDHFEREIWLELVEILIGERRFCTYIREMKQDDFNLKMF